MTITQALREIRSSGVELAATDAGFVIRGSPEARALVRPIVAEHRDEIVNRIQAGRLVCKSCKKILDERFVCWTCQDRPCVVCGRLTGTPFIMTCDPCALRGDSK